MDRLFRELRGFDFGASTAYLWVFKRSTTAAKFNAKFVQTDDKLSAVLKTVVASEMARITEHADYTYLAETNPNSCLTERVAGSDFVSLKALVDRPEPDHRLENTKDLNGIVGYVVKFVHNGRCVYAVKRSTNTWKVSYLKTHINIVFSNGELSAAEDKSFAIEKNFDFYVLDDGMFIAAKRAFESVMEHRASFAQAFMGLQVKPEFSGLFTDMRPLVDYVGTNSMQLRRMARIDERALYQRPGFLQGLNIVSQRRNWGLNFDAGSGRLIPCDVTAKTIIDVLLDHRLLSEVTSLTYVVPDATQT